MSGGRDTAIGKWSGREGMFGLDGWDWICWLLRVALGCSVLLRAVLGCSGLLWAARGAWLLPAAPAAPGCSWRLLVVCCCCCGCWLFGCLSVRSFVRPFVCLSVCRSVCLSVRRSVCLSVCLFARLSVCLGLLEWTKRSAPLAFVTSKKRLLFAMATSFHGTLGSI